MLVPPAWRVLLLSVGLLACSEATAPPAIPASFGFMTLSFQGRSLRFSEGFDSIIAYYDPVSRHLSLRGTTAPGPFAPDNLFALIDSLPADGSYPLDQQRHLSVLSVSFYETPESDSSRVYPFHTLDGASDQVTLDLLDFSTCEVRGSLQANLFFPNDPTPYPVRGAFWGRMIRNTTAPGPC